MRSMVIDGVDFHALPCQKYWQPPASWSTEKKKAETRRRIFEGDWYGARKMDGAFYEFIKSDLGDMELIGRSKGVSGDYLNKIEWVPQFTDFFNALPNGTCLLGEVVFPDNEGSRNTTTIMGCLKDKAIARQEKGPKLHYYVFDILAYDGKSLLNTPAADRFQMTDMFFEKYSYDYIDFATYYTGEALWEYLQIVLEIGGEGIVMTKGDSLYAPDKRPSKTCMKVKKEITNTIDCFFTGKGTEPTKHYIGKELPTWKYWVDSVTDERLPEKERYFDYVNGAPLIPVTKPYYNNWVGSMEIAVVKEDKVIPIGFLSGLADEIKANPIKYKGRVIEVSAMQIEKDTHALRHGKMLGFRDSTDKTWKDCTWDQIVDQLA